MVEEKSIKIQEDKISNNEKKASAKKVRDKAAKKIIVKPSGKEKKSISAKTAKKTIKTKKITVKENEKAGKNPLEIIKENHPIGELIAKEPVLLPPGDDEIIRNEDLLRKKEYQAEVKTKIDEKSFNFPVLEQKPSFDQIPVNINKSNDYKPQSINTILNKSENDGREKSKHHLKLYRNIVLLFVFSTIILAGLIFYFTILGVTITLIPNQENISNNMIFDVFDTEKNNSGNINAIPGVVKKVNISTEKVYSATGEEVVGKEAIGKATIINSYDKNQPLVATTRLLTADSKLFRIKNTVNVPAGGSVEIEIYADQPSEEMAIGPSRFTIPGLWAGLQDKIYAQSEEPVVYQQKVKKHITESDMEGGKEDLKQEIVKKAKEQIEENYKDFGKVIYNIDEGSITSEISAKAGDEKEEFTGKMSADVIVTAFNEDKAKSLAKQKFILSLPEDKESILFNEDKILYSLNSNDLNSGIATINASFDGKVTLKDNNSIIDTSKLIGLNKDQLNAYLSELPDIAGYEVRFSPSFMWGIPRFIEASKIKIEIKK